MHEQPNCAYDTVLPIKPGDNGYALHFLVVIFYEADMPFEIAMFSQPEKFKA
jgi:hypothetical protein